MKYLVGKFQNFELEGLSGRKSLKILMIAGQNQFLVLIAKKSYVISPYPLFKDVEMEALEVGFVVMTNCQ